LLLTANSRPGNNIPNKLFPRATAWFTGGVNVNLGIWSRLTSVVLVLVVVAVLLLIGTCYLPVIRENQRMEAQIMKLEAQVQAEEEKSKNLQNQIDALQNDPKTVERLTREKLGYAKPNETVIYFENTNEMR
jgi:cell division protein DivIC